MLLLVALAAVQVFLGSGWLTVSMLKGSEVIELGTLTGAQLYPAAASILILGWLALLLLAISKGISRFVFTVALAVAVATAGFIATTGILNGNYQAQESQLSNWRNIAAAHDISDLTLAPAGFALAFAIAVALAIVASVATWLSISTWPVRAASTEQPSAGVATADLTEPTDAISIWEEQRKH